MNLYQKKNLGYGWFPRCNYHKRTHMGDCQEREHFFNATLPSPKLYSIEALITAINSPFSSHGSTPAYFQQALWHVLPPPLCYGNTKSDLESIPIACNFWTWESCSHASIILSIVKLSSCSHKPLPIGMLYVKETVFAKLTNGRKQKVTMAQRINSRHKLALLEKAKFWN